MNIKFNLTTVGTLIAVLAGLGTIVAGLGFVLDMFYVPRAEFNVTQAAYTETLQKLDNLEIGLINLTHIFLKGEISTLNRDIEELEEIENRTDKEDDYLSRLRTDVADLESQLNTLQ